MKPNLLFYIGMAIHILLLLFVLYNIGLIHQITSIWNIKWRFLWFVPVLFTVIPGIAAWLWHMGRTIFATILLWLPAIPAVGGILLWLGFIIIFKIFGPQK